MTFSAQVKEELCSVEEQKRSLVLAEAYGLLLFAHRFGAQEISLQTENERVARRYQNLLKQSAGVAVCLTLPKKKGGMITAAVPDQTGRDKLLELFGHTGTELALRANRANLEEDGCVGAFLRGAFLACGTLTNPQKDYHLEFLLSRRKLAMDLVHILGEAGLQAKTVTRRSALVVYLKESEQIEDLLTLMQAVKSSLECMNVKIYKDMRNRVNRMTNCETANLSKTVEAVRKQIWAIDLIESTIGLDSLPARLREVAQVRRENEEMSLSELGGALSQPLTRSGVNHRLQKIIELAEQLQSQT